MTRPHLSPMTATRAVRLKEVLFGLPVGATLHLAHHVVTWLCLLAVGFGTGAAYSFFHLVPQVCR